MDGYSQPSYLQLLLDKDDPDEVWDMCITNAEILTCSSVAEQSFVPETHGNLDAYLVLSMHQIKQCDDWDCSVTNSQFLACAEQMGPTFDDGGVADSQLLRDVQQIERETRGTPQLSRILLMRSLHHVLILDFPWMLIAILHVIVPKAMIDMMMNQNLMLHSLYTSSAVPDQVPAKCAVRGRPKSTGHTFHQPLSQEEATQFKLKMFAKGTNRSCGQATCMQSGTDSHQ